MKQERGMTLISLLIVGSLAMSCVVLGLKLVPVYSEFFAVKKAFSKVVSSADPTAPAATFRAAFQRFAQVDDIHSIDPQTIGVSKDSGKVSLQVSYRREVPLFANVGLYFDFDVSSN
jgi:hypothetical protein